MIRKTTLGTASIALALGLAGCGGEKQGGLTSEEERQLDNAAAMLEDNVFDTSADSLVGDGTEIENGAGITEGNSGNAE
jgi:hypothetical protein